MKERHILACLSSSPSSLSVIRAASSAAEVYHCRFTALCVLRHLKEIDPGMAANIAAAEQAGAQVQQIQGSDVISSIADFAVVNHVSDVYIGKSGPPRSFGFHKQPYVRLMKALPRTDIHVIPDAEVILTPSHLHQHAHIHLTLAETGKMAAIMGIATIICALFYHSRYSNDNIITIYLLAVLVTSVVTAERIYGVASALLFVFLFNFLFIEPRFTLMVYDPYYIVTYAVSMIAALITSSVAARLKQSTRVAMESADQSQVLLDASELLQHAVDADDIIRITSNQLVQLMGRSVIFYPVQERKLAKPLYFPASQQETPLPDEREAAEWTLANNHRSGAFTSEFSQCQCQYLSVRVSEQMYGVIGIRMQGRPLSEFEKNILLSLIGECGLSLENNENNKRREKMEIVAENERFRANLLRSVSHDLRTPLTSISGNASNLVNHADVLSEQQKQGIYADIYDDSMWLIELVENMLSVTRLEEGSCLHPSVEVVQDVIDESLKHVDRHIRDHHLNVIKDNDFTMAEMDVRLISQVIINLVNNAVKYSGKGSDITIQTKRDHDLIWVQVKDNGPGVAKEDQPHLFERFYTGHHKIADSQRSLGLGLNLCQSIMKAHGQQLVYQDNVPHGACFCFSLHVKELTDELV
ncbi:DUF4118 domain-containing protein [Lactimicrobium sp.]|uniref:DUF4118 domain-containing protein n=1 Tax=Lactimicrobium sp. TaxID=2563780 RepID=UPI002F351D40